MKAIRELWQLMAICLLYLTFALLGYLAHVYVLTVVDIACAAFWTVAALRHWLWAASTEPPAKQPEDQP